MADPLNTQQSRQGWPWWTARVRWPDAPAQLGPTSWGTPVVPCAWTAAVAWDPGLDLAIVTVVGVFGMRGPRR